MLSHRNVQQNAVDDRDNVEKHQVHRPALQYI